MQNNTKNYLMTPPKLSAGLWVSGSIAATIVLVGVATFGPFKLLAAVGAVALTSVGLIAQAGFPIALSLVSHVSTLGGVDFELIRMLKWLLVAIFAATMIFRMIVEKSQLGLPRHPVLNYFAIFAIWGGVCSLLSPHSVASFTELGRICGFLVIFYLTSKRLRPKRLSISFCSR